jgi:O-antigen ligase
MLAFIVLLAYAMSHYTFDLAVGAALCALFGLLCFVRVKWVLFILIFACLFSPEIRIGAVLGRAAKRPFTLRVEDVLLTMILLTWLARAAVDKELGLMLRTPLNRPIFLYSLVCVLATALGITYGWVKGPERLGAAMFVLKYIQYFVLFFVIVNYLDTAEDVRNVLIAAVLTYVAVCIYGFWQIPRTDRPSLVAEYHSEPNTLAGYLVFMIGICGGLMLTAGSFLRRLGWAVLALIGLVLVGYTLSRSGWAGLLGVALVLVLVARHRLVMLGLAAVVALTVLLSYNAGWLPDAMTKRMDETFGKAAPVPGQPPAYVFGLKLDPSATERYGSYKDALGTWWDRSMDYWVPALTGSGVLGGRPFVDGQYVRVLAETGVLGLAAFLVLLGTIWRDAWRASRELETPWHRGLALGYLAGFAGLMVHALGANTFIIVRVMEPFFIITGLVVLLPILERGEKKPRSMVRPVP